MGKNMLQKLNRLRGTIRDRITRLNKAAESYEPPATPEESEISLNQKFQNVLELKAQMKKLLADYLDLSDSTNLEEPLEVIYNMEEEIEVLQTVTYGTTSAPFLATRTLQQLAKDERENFPIASKVLLEDFYMDDCLSGAADINQFMALKKELGEVLLRGGMTLHKWCSSASSESDLYPFNYCEKQSTVKTLGMMWNNGEDAFLLDISTSSTTEFTKRDVLSQIDRLFDPLGLLGPVISKAKIFFQRLWLLQIDWSQKLPSDIAQEWSSFIASLSYVKNIKIPRIVLRPNSKEIVLHGFSDASEKAYDAVIYLQSVCDSSDNNTFLLCSKSRVAPIKSVAIPRLELAACLLLAQLTRKVLNALKLKIDQVLLWTDSTIALSWIDTPPHLLKTFVSNRVAQIQELTKEYHWSHITSKNNPADLLSRGIDAQFLVNNQFWFQGPDSFNSLNSETELNQSDKNYLSEFKSKDSVCLTVKTSALFDDVICISNNFQKLIRIISLIFRFINKCKKNSKECGAPSKIERQNAEIDILREVQAKKRTFDNEIHSLEQCGNVTPNSKLKSLSPFLDSQGILRVGGPQALLYNIRQKFWPLNGQTLCRKIVHSCVTCFKPNPKISSQKMGDLPEDRVNTYFVFNSVDIDFAEPFYIKTKLRKRYPPTKIYVCIIIYLSTKVSHLELVSYLSSESLIAALKRFMARRGKCRKILSDNATKNEINRLSKLIEQQGALFQNFLSEEEITWSHITPRAPHHGGLWEGSVKSFKFYFKRVVNNTCLTYEEFLTILIQIEGLLNSRPLTPLSSEVEDLEILTPGHFLIGRPITAIPEPLMIELNDSRLNRWQLLTKKVQAIWKH
ncbi:hypothetical protein AVEN_146283-1 [Araneus ventricosus]|uniref:Integrase catalytic domain-containing protein n=1 Tax=Araneus ventricosus TaxID=182803 RepID=A0A4Y2VIN9_ARAVE|nr:hypothetical protein AVEN_146283-1 [Araneus ventricosus]